MLVVGHCAAASPWQKLPSLPKSSAGAACGVVDGRIIMIGGTNWDGGRKNWLRDVYSLDPRIPGWRSLQPIDQPLAYAITGTFKGRLIVAGGSTGSAPFPGTIEFAQGRLEVRQAHGIAAPVVLSAAGMIGEEFICAGGTDDAANVKAFHRNTVAWNVVTDGLRVLAPYPGPAFGGAGAEVVGDELLVFGGCVWDARTQSVSNFPESYAYSASRNAWRRLRDLPYAVRGIAAVRLDDGRLYLAGGYKNDAEGFVDQGFIYKVAEDRYEPAAPLPYRGCVGLVADAGDVYCIGGEDMQKHRSDAAYRVAIGRIAP